MPCLYAFCVSFLPVRTSYQNQTTLMVAASNNIETPFPIPISRVPPWLSDLTGIIYHCSVRRTTRRSVFNIPPQQRANWAAISYVGVRTTQATHLDRKTGAQLAELGGADRQAIARAGGWADGIMDNMYLSKFPRESMRACTRFERRRRIVLLASAGRRSRELQRMVFPDIEKW